MNRRIAAIIAAGILARLIVCAITDPSADLFGGDAAYYAAGHIDGLRPPLYTLFLSATLPVGWWFPLVLQSALTIGAGVATALVFPGRAGFIAGLVYATCPFFALFDIRLLSESLYLNLLWLGWLALFRKQSVGAGLLVGLAILTRDTLALLPLFTLVFLRTKPAAVMTLVAYLTILPWVAYNGSLSQGRMGLNLWAGTWERNGDWYLNGLDRPQFPAYAFRSLAEEQFVRSRWPDDDALRRAAVARMAADPAATALTWAERYPRLWIGTRSDHVTFRAQRGGAIWTAEKLGLLALDIALLVFGLWGLRRPQWLFVPPIAYAGLVAIPFHAEARYTLFALPFLICLGVSQLNQAEAAKAPDR